MRLSSLLLLTVLLSSCAGFKAKKKARICATCPIITVKVDSVVTRLKDTTIYITQAGPVQYIDNPCSELCDSAGNLKAGFMREVKKGGIRTIIKVVRDSLVIEPNLDSLRAQMQVEISERFNMSTHTIEVERKKTKFEVFQSWFFWVVIALGAGFAVAKLG